MENRNSGRPSTGDVAAGYFADQFHCAEAVAKAVLNAKGECAKSAVACATAFGGGFGRCFEEACGALSGGLVAIGQLHGRRGPGESWDYPASLGAMLREAFVEEFGTTRCGELRQRFGDAQEVECRKLVRFTADTLAEMLETPVSCQGKVSCGCR
ncbi:C-GCAxxG-C-C family protein [Desulfovibrio mangrovi]|uniref:C-GCAxxG-C-C family protein n=1 Tax=Desulfovibrio mangrovi TaxID=2976983 RepID=UPI002245A428|nr:C-GCAxxG-C-C family protein [Desulfovibrio mangrovi]UZP66877.1 C-GCAxxG-C-C family protein [Desulfovibrio mangrovi]